MNQAIHFKTSMFDVSKERENPINPIYGLSLLEWLRNELKGQLEVTEPDAEDWGWYSELKYDGNSYLIGSCAYFEEGDDPNQELEWVFQVEKYRSFKEKIFGKKRWMHRIAAFCSLKGYLRKIQISKRFKLRKPLTRPISIAPSGLDLATLDRCWRRL